MISSPLSVYHELNAPRGAVRGVAFNSPPVHRGAVHLRPIALPAEHGGWAFLLEPVALGLLLAPSFGGVCVTIAAVGVFLGRHPLRLALNDFRRRRPLRRTFFAKVFAGVYFTTATLALVTAFFAASPRLFLPLVIAFPIIAVQFCYDASGRSRSIIAEIAGVTATGAIAAAIALAGGWGTALGFGLWAVMFARSVPATLYIRTRLKLIRGKKASIFLVIIAHLAALALALVLAAFHWAPLLAVIAMGIAYGRAVNGLRRNAAAASPKQLGLREIVYGTITVVATVTGHAIGW